MKINSAMQKINGLSLKRVKIMSDIDLINS